MKVSKEKAYRHEIKRQYKHTRHIDSSIPVDTLYLEDILRLSGCWIGQVITNNMGGIQRLKCDLSWRNSCIKAIKDAPNRFHTPKLP